MIYPWKIVFKTNIKNYNLYTIHHDQLGELAIQNYSKFLQNTMYVHPALHVSRVLRVSNRKFLQNLETEVVAKLFVIALTILLIIL